MITTNIIENNYSFFFFFQFYFKEEKEVEISKNLMTKKKICRLDSFFIK
jgi:hypothetical protein